MLSILRVQSKQLEKELLETRQALEVLKRKEKEFDQVIAERDERIKDLEEELRRSAVAKDDFGRVLCNACGRSADYEVTTQRL